LQSIQSFSLVFFFPQKCQTTYQEQLVLITLHPSPPKNKKKRMYDNMTTYMLSDSPESGSGSNHQLGGNSSSNAPSLIGSPRSTPVFGNNGHALK
ncbi:Uncharacterized protein APZ42_010422, partial [Daphnia magna]